MSASLGPSEDDSYEGFDDQERRSVVNPAALLLHAAGRFPFSISAIAGLVFLGAVGYAFSQPNTYKSQATMLVRMGAREAQTAESAIDPDGDNRGTSAATSDELIMLQDPALQARVVDVVGAARILAPYDPFSADSDSTPQHIRWVHQLQSWLMNFRSGDAPQDQGEPTRGMRAGAIERLANGTAISTPRGTNTIHVAFTSHRAEVAQEVTAAYLEVFQERHREFHETSEEFSFVADRAKEADEAAEAARKAWLDQRTADGIHDFKAHLDSLATEIQLLDEADRVAKVERDSLERQLEVIDGQLQDTPSLLVIEEEEGAADAAEADVDGAEASVVPSDAPLTASSTELLAQLQRVNAELASLEDEYAPGSAYFTKESARLQATSQSIREQLRELQGQPAGGVAPVGAPLLGVKSQPQINPIHVDLKAQRFELLRRLGALDAAAEARTGVLAKNRSELERLMKLEPTYARLELAVRQTSRRAAELAQAHARSAALQMIDSDEQMANLMVTQEPSLPKKKDGPDRVKVLLAGMVAGLALGLGQALARVLIDRRLRYPIETANSLGVRILGVVPEQREWRRNGKRLRDRGARNS